MSNIAEAICSIWELLVSVSFVVGLVFVISSLLMTATLADQFHNRQFISYSIALITFFTGIVLISLPELMSVGSNTIGNEFDNMPFFCTFAATSLLDYKSGNDDIGYVSVKLAYLFFMLFGWISFFRGLLALRSSSFSKGITFIIAGILLANIEWVDFVIGRTLGANNGVINGLIT